MTASLSPHEAWQPLAASEWNADAARHLLRRAGWSARAEDVARAEQDGLAATLDRLFPANPPHFEKPRMVARFEQMVVPFQREMQRTSPEDRFRAQREFQERSRVGLQELSLKW